MAQITRFLQKIFGKDSAGIGVFGSAAAGTPTLATDAEDVSNLAAYEDGFEAATITAEEFPALEDVNGLFFQLTTQLKYLFQQGMPEYLATETYYENNFVKSDAKIYVSKTNDNTGNALSDTDHWELALDLTPSGGGGFGSSLAENGYRTNSDGTIEQWGYVTSIPSNSTKAVTFEKEFPTACWNVQLTIMHSNRAENGNIAVYGSKPSTTGFTMSNDSDTTWYGLS